MSSSYQKSFFQAGDDLLNCIQQHFHFHQNSQILAFRDIPQTLGGAGFAMFSERQIEFLSDCDDLQARATRGLSIVFCLSLPFISLIVIAKIFFCHPTKFFLRDSQNSFWGRCSFSSNSMTRLHGMMHSGSIDWAWIYAVISSIQGEKNEGININITN